MKPAGEIRASGVGVIDDDMLSAERLVITTGANMRMLREHDAQAATAAGA